MNKTLEYKCPSCGAQLITDSNTSISSCVYCKNNIMSKNELQEDSNIDCIIKFKTTKEDAIKAFEKLCKGKWLIPSNFNIKKNIKNITGIYIPFFICDMDSTGIIESDCEKVSNWKSSGYKYTKIDKYKVIRGGNISFKNIPVYGSKKIENNVINSIQPYDYNEMKKIDYSYVSGFLKEKHEFNEEQTINEATNIVKNLFIDEMKKDIKGYNKKIIKENSINLYNTKSSYVLLPLWFLNIKYRNKIYTLAMNGQTGKVTGNIPIDIKKIIFIWFLLFIIILILLFIINVFKVML